MKVLFNLALTLLLVGCGGGASSGGSDGDSSSDITEASHRDTLRGTLSGGESTALAIVEKNGAEDTTQVDVDVAKTELSGAETKLLGQYKGQELWIRGDLTKRDTGKTVHGSKILVDVLVATSIVVVDKDSSASDGILRKLANGTFDIEIKAGDGKDSDDAGSFALDVGALPSVSAFVDKSVHVEGLLGREITGIVANTYFESTPFVVATSLR